MQVRRQARISALQALYELDTTNHPAGDVLAYRLEELQLPPEGEAFLRILVSGVLSHRDRLDSLIQQHAPAWPVTQIAVIDRNILRIALFELSGQTDTPAKVAINEAVDLAKMFGSDSSSRFVNGVLGSAIAGRKHIDLARPPTSSGTTSGAPDPEPAKD
ncbi:MAG TPA: transcription antitermination factor NusB [Anaerolineae bacterium]